MPADNPAPIAPITLAEFTDATEKKLAEGGLFATAPMTVRGVDYPHVFAASSMSLRDVIAMKAAEFAEAELIVYEDTRMTVGETWAAACQFAHVLIEKFSVAPGDRVAIAMRNYPEWCIAYLGIIAAGATVVPLNAWWKEEELTYAVKDSGLKLVIGDAKRLDRLASIKGDAGLTFIVAREESDHADHRLDDLLADQPTTPPQITIDADSDYCVLYTSGSTGNPKGVLLTHRGVINAILSWSFTLDVYKAMRPDATFVADNPAVLLALPLFHVTALHTVFLLSLLQGRKIVFLYRWEATAALKVIRDEDITNLVLVPTQAHEIVMAAKPGDLDNIIDVATGGAKRPPRQVEELKERHPDLNTSSGYGLTETNALGCHVGMTDFVQNPDCTGRVIPPVTDIKIMSEDMTELPVGEVGEICIKSPANFRGYLNLPEETAATLTEDGWFRTGDLGRFDEDGFLYIVDRLKDIIIRGGENISCLEVENAIYGIEGVQEVAVFGVPHERLGECVGAVIYPRPGATLDLPQIYRDLRDHLADFKLPAKMWVAPQQLPRGNTGKIDKRTTKQIALENAPHFDAEG